MKKMVIRLFSMVITLCMFLSVFAGCASKENTKSDNTTTTASSAGEQGSGNTTAPEEDTSPITLTAIMHPQLAANKWGEDDVSKAITEKTGVTLDVTFQSAWDDKELSTLLASGSKLPDFIVVTYGTPIDNILHSQGYVQPLNKLAEQYYPEFLKYIPQDMDKIYGEADGNLYCVGDMYGDYSHLDASGMTSFVDTGMAYNKPLLEKIGNPSLDTLADVKAALMKAKEMFPEYKNLVSFESPDPTQYRSADQILNKCFGGQHIMSIGSDGNVHMNFRDESYLNALEYIGDLYRSKLLSAENFTMSPEQKKEEYINNRILIYFGFYFNLGGQLPTTFTNETPYWAMEMPAAPGVSREQIKLNDQFAGLGGWHSVHISKDCSNPKRALQYMAFMMSEEGQLLQRLGVKGKGYEDDPNGGFKFTQTKVDLASTDNAKVATQLGIDNWNWCWFEGFNVIVRGEAINAKSLPALKDYYDKYGKYAAKERINLLTANIKNTDMQVLRTKIDELWKTSYLKIILTPSEEKLVEEYNNFIAQAEKLGLAQLEAAYTENYKLQKDKVTN